MAHLLQNPDEAQPSQQNQNKGSVRSSRSILNYHSLQPAAGCSAVIQAAQLVPRHCLASGSLLEAVCGVQTAISHMAAKASRTHASWPETAGQRVCEGTCKCFTRLERERETETETFLEAMGHTATKDTWTMKRTGQCTHSVQVSPVAS